MMSRTEIAERLLAARRFAAVFCAFTIPLSTSGLAISSAVFVVLALLTVGRSEWLAILASPVALVPVSLFLLLLLGMTWSPTPLASGGGIGHYVKLLLIPIAMGARFTAGDITRIGCGFVSGCLIVLALSFSSFFVQLPPPFRPFMDGVPLKDNAVQTGCFALCAFGLALHGVQLWTQDRKALGAALIAFAMVFIANIFLIFISKTGVLMTAALAVLFVFHVGRLKRLLLVAAPVLLIAAIAVWSSPLAQRRLAEISVDIHAVENSSRDRPDATFSTASRIDFWSKAVEFIKQAPLIGHGTGSTKSLYQSLESSRPSPYGEAVPDPHNQFFAIAIQVGLLGGGILLAMWGVHFSTFLGTGIVNALGQAIVVQNVIGSQFNSHVSTVTQGTLYCLLIGLLAGVVERPRR